MPVEVYESRSTRASVVFLFVAAAALGTLGIIGWAAGRVLVGLSGTVSGLVFAYAGRRALGMLSKAFGRVEFFEEHARILPEGSEPILVRYQSVERIARREGPDRVVIYLREGRVEEVPPCTFADYPGLKAVLVRRLMEAGVEFEAS